MAVLQKAETLQLKITEKDRLVCLELALVANAPETAQRIADVARGLIAFGQLSEESEPLTAKLAQSAQVKQDGKQVKLLLCCPVEDVIQWVKSHRGQRKAHQAVSAGVGG